MIKLRGIGEDAVSRIVYPGTIMLAYRGSIAHGMYIPNSDPNSIDDKDLMGLCIPDIKFYFGLNSFEQHEAKYKEWDSVIYEFRKFVRLLVQQNPNVMSLLWNEPNHYIFIEEPARRLIERRDLFVSRKAYHAFTGYAYGQLKKMTALAFNGYMGEKRKGLVEKFGYDTKNAAHLIRLLKMGIEFLRDGRLYVDRGVVGDSQQLLAIKRGEWTLEQVKAEAEHLFRRAEAAFDSSTLRPSVDTQAADRLVTEIISDYFGVERRANLTPL